MTQDIDLGGDEPWFEFTDELSGACHRHATYVPESEFDDVVKRGGGRDVLVRVSNGQRSFTMSGVSSCALKFFDDEITKIPAEEVPDHG